MVTSRIFNNSICHKKWAFIFCVGRLKRPTQKNAHLLCPLHKTNDIRIDLFFVSVFGENFGYRKHGGMTGRNTSRLIVEDVELSEKLFMFCRI
jgi:hypothetical protein